MTAATARRLRNVSHMKLTLPRMPLALVGAGLLLAGCASHPARSVSTPVSHPQATSGGQPTPAAQESGSKAGTGVSQGHHRTHASAPEQAVQLPDSTGIPACDDYLSSYVACHRAAAIYKPDQLQGRYEAMRTSLLRDSQDPDIRPNLAARCNSLASQLRQALHGKSCEAGPAMPGSQAGH